MSINAKTIEIFLPSGDPLKVEEAIITTSNIKIIHLNQNEIDNYKQKIDQNGCYILYGKDKNEEELIYVGEADNLCERLYNQKKDKGFWNEAYLIVHTGNRFDKTHLHYLENLIIEKAKSSKRYRVDNVQNGQKNTITESKESECLIFFEDIKLILHTLGLNLFKPKNQKNSISKSNYFYYKNENLGYDATAIYENNELTVLENSKVRIKSNMKKTKLQKKLINEEVLQKKENYYIFTKDYTFTSPSAAADIVSGQSSNGWIVWKNLYNHKTLDDLFRNTKKTLY